MIKKSILLSLSTVLVAIIGFITQVVLTRAMSLEAYGTFKIVLSFIATLSIFSLPSFNTLVTKAASQGYRRFFITANIWCFTVSLIGSVILVILSFTSQTQIQFELWLAAIFFPFYSGINIAQAQLLGLKKYNSAAVLAILISASLAIFQIAVIYSSVFSLTHLVFFTLLVQSIINLFATLILVMQIRSDKKDPQKDKELILFGSKLTGLSVFSILSSQLQYLLLGYFIGPAYVAIYAVAQTFPDKIKPIFKALFSPYSVMLSSQKKQVSLQIVRNSLLLLGITGMCMAIGAIIFLPFLIKIGFGARYQDAISITQILSLSLIVLPFSSIIGSVMVYHDDEPNYRRLTMFKDILLLIGFTIFVPVFAIKGIVVVQLVVLFVQGGLFVRWVIKHVIIDSYPVTITHHQPASNQISPDLNGYNMIQVIRSTEIKADRIPFWVKIIAPLSYTKVQRSS